jgi:hypothetical protein
MSLVSNKKSPVSWKRTGRVTNISWTGLFADFSIANNGNPRKGNFCGVGHAIS